MLMDGNPSRTAFITGTDFEKFLFYKESCFNNIYEFNLKILIKFIIRVKVLADLEKFCTLSVCWVAILSADFSEINYTKSITK